MSPDFKLMGQALIYGKQKAAGLKKKVEHDLALHLRTTPGTDIFTLVQSANSFLIGLGGEGDNAVSFFHPAIKFKEISELSPCLVGNLLCLQCNRAKMM